jgi:hypothetical protein
LPHITQPNILTTASQESTPRLHRLLHTLPMTSVLLVDSRRRRLSNPAATPLNHHRLPGYQHTTVQPQLSTITFAPAAPFASLSSRSRPRRTTARPQNSCRRRMESTSPCHHIKLGLCTNVPPSRDQGAASHSRTLPPDPKLKGEECNITKRQKQEGSASRGCFARQE